MVGVSQLSWTLPKFRAHTRIVITRVNYRFRALRTTSANGVKWRPDKILAGQVNRNARMPAYGYKQTYGEVCQNVRFTPVSGQPY